MRNRDLILYSALGLGLWFLFIRGRNANPGTFMPNSPDSFDSLENMIIPQTVSSQGRQFIKSMEGFTAFPKADAKGTSEVGYGHQILPGEDFSNGLTPLQASNLMDQDLIPVEDAIVNSVTVPINQNQFDALADFAYEEGITAFTTSTLLKMLNNGNYGGASQQFSRWVYANGQVNPALQSRRQNDTNLFNA